MRYVAAMVCAVPMALLFTLYVSSPFASWLVTRFTFDSPDTVADLHSFAFMAMNVVGLAIGWTIGWALGGRLEKNVPHR